LSDDTTIQAKGIRKSRASDHITIVMMSQRVRSARVRTAREEVRRDVADREEGVAILTMGRS
jgi:hypothetical protein